MTLNLNNKGRAIAKFGKKIVSIDDSSSVPPVKIISIEKTGDTFRQIPSIDSRETLYIAGKSGSGKSTYAASYIKYYNKLFPDNIVYLISKVIKDDAFEEVKNLKRITPDLFEGNEDLDLDASQFENCLVVFDDIDQFIDKIKKPITLLRDQLLEVGRHNNVYVISTAHLLTNYKQSRVLLNEAHSVTFFPQSGFHNIQRYLKMYVGLSNEQISNIKKSNSRWITVFQSYPTIIMEEKKIYIP